MRESDRLIKLSEHIRDIFVSENISEDQKLLLRAWNDFIVSISKVSPLLNNSY